MKRRLNFDFENGKYVIKEDDKTIFTIDHEQLKFVSLDFYNGVYKGKHSNIELKNCITDDSAKKGDYIFAWLTEIIEAIKNELKDSDLDSWEDETGTVLTMKQVPLFELSACAGDGFYSDGPIDIKSKVETVYGCADFAVTISGKSMEPTIKDGDMVFVQNVKVLLDGDVGIFVVDGQVMCKRYRENGTKKWLEPDNESDEFNVVQIKQDTNCIIQGKVLLDSIHER